MRRPRHRWRQRGAALLMAMLTVTLVATFAAAAMWQQWRAIEVEASERARIQASWVLVGALDWARLLLREDDEAVDHMGEPWAVPLQEARLSSFLAADSNNTVDTGPEVFEAFLSGQIIDLQSVLNVSRLVQADAAQQQRDYDSFARLFEMLGLPQSELNRLAENMRFASDTSADNQSRPMAPLLPQQVEQLVWLGLSAQTVAALAPYLTVLPAANTSINLNTASAEVIYAAVPSLSMAEAQHLVNERERSPFTRMQNVYDLLEGGATRMPAGQVAVGIKSNFFEVRSRLRLEQLVVEERAVVQRDGNTMLVVHRERGIADPTALSQAAPKR